MNVWLKVALWCIPTFVVGWIVGILTGVIAMCSSDNPIGIACLIISLLSVPIFLIAFPIGLLKHFRRKEALS